MAHDHANVGRCVYPNTEDLGELLGGNYATLYHTHARMTATGHNRNLNGYSTSERVYTYNTFLFPFFDIESRIPTGTSE